MEDEYGRILECPRCGSRNIKQLTSPLLYRCLYCGLYGFKENFRAVPKIDFNPSRRVN